MPCSRAEARAAGKKHYWTGIPCSKGHINFRHLTGTCIECQQLANRRWDAKNPGEMARRASKWQRDNPERARARSLTYYRKKAGIPEAMRPAPLNCENCEKLLVPSRFHLDHCHATGKFRGWLCNQCNMGIGALGDNIQGLERALEYLRRSV